MSSYQNVRKKLNGVLKQNINQQNNQLNLNNFKNIGEKKMERCLDGDSSSYERCEFIKCVIYIFSYALYLTDSNKGTNKYTFYSERKNLIRDHYKELPNKSLFKIIIHYYVQEIFSINFLNKKGTKETKLNYNTKDIIKILKTYEIFIEILGNPNEKIKNKYINNKKIGQGAEAEIYELTKNLVLRIQVVKQKNQKTVLQLQNARENLKIVNEKCPEAAYKLFYGEGIYDIYEKGITDISIILKNLKIWNNNSSITDIDKNKKLIKLYINLLIKCIEKIKCIHKQNILHLDIKPENIMIFEGTNEDYDIDLTDYNELRTIKTSNIGDEIVLPIYLKVKYIEFNLSEKVDNASIKRNDFNVDYKTDLYAFDRMFQELILRLNNRSLENRSTGKNNQLTNNLIQFYLKTI